MNRLSPEKIKQETKIEINSEDVIPSDITSQKKNVKDDIKNELKDDLNKTNETTPLTIKVDEDSNVATNKTKIDSFNGFSSIDVDNSRVFLKNLILKSNLWTEEMRDLFFSEIIGDHLEDISGDEGLTTAPLEPLKNAFKFVIQPEFKDEVFFPSSPSSINSDKGSSSPSSSKENIIDSIKKKTSPKNTFDQISIKR